MRRIHVVGTVAAAGPLEAMTLLSRRLGPYLASIPDGETDRPNWVIEMIEARADNPDLATVRRSRMSQPRALRPVLDPPRYRPRRTLTPAVLKLPYAAQAARAWPILQALPALKEGTPLQVGIPAPLDVAAFSWLRPLHYYDAEALAALREVEAIHELTGGRVVYQVEIPLETVAVAKAPARLRARVAEGMARRLCAFIAAFPHSAQVIVHACYGNKDNQPLASPGDAAPLTELGNALHAHWPAEQRFNALHLPLGDVTNPVPYKPAFFAPLTDLALPDNVHVSAGLVRHDASLGMNRQALDTAEETAGRRLGVSTSCGWGRQPQAANALMDLLVALAAT